MTTLTAVKVACIEALGKEDAYAAARNIAADRTTESVRYTLSHKLVWEVLHTQLLASGKILDEVAKSTKVDVENVSFSDVCTTLEQEKNPFLAMLLVSVWLLSNWIHFLVWAAPYLISVGVATREYVTFAANLYTTISHRTVHGVPFEKELPKTHRVDGVIAYCVEAVLKIIDSLLPILGDGERLFKMDGAIDVLRLSSWLEPINEKHCRQMKPIVPIPNV